MSSMLEQAIVDATALREAAMQNAESAIIEKYSFEMKEAIEKLLEQEEDQLGADFFDDGLQPDALDQAPPAAAEDLELCPCPEDGESVEMEFSLDDLRELAAEMEEGEPAPSEDLATELGAEEEEDEEEFPLQESIELDEEVEIEEEIQEEELDMEDTDISELLEELIVDLSGDDLTGWAGRPESDKASLNERQKEKIVESIQSSESIEEAKVIYETLQSAVGPSKKQPKSLSEAIQRPSLSVRRRKNSSDDRENAAKQRFQLLAGIVKD